MKPLIWAIELHDTLAIAVTKDQSMPVLLLLLLLPLLQFIGLPDNYGEALRRGITLGDEACYRRARGA
jgi:hypothetical protein